LILLLVDIGNTRVKWARLADGQMGKQQAAANAGWGVEEYARRVIGRGWVSGRGAGAAAREGGSARGAVGGAVHEAAATRSVGAAAHATGGARAGAASDTGAGRIVVSSVAGDDVNRALAAAAREAGAPAPEFVATERSAAGITTDYLDPWRLGVDRFVGAIGAHHLASGQPVCVVNVGTAITIDLVDGSGRHHGGAIVPGPALMVSSLLTQTNGIQRRATGGPSGSNGIFAKTTRTAIAEGARYTAAAVIDRAIEEARIRLGSRPLVLLTGGGSADIKPLIRSTSVSLPDLVLHGLAVWARQSPPPVQQAETSRKRRRLN
jgi:type III pantothenate kinase